MPDNCFLQILKIELLAKSRAFEVTFTKQTNFVPIRDNKACLESHKAHRMIMIMTHAVPLRLYDDYLVSLPVLFTSERRSFVPEADSMKTA